MSDPFDADSQSQSDNLNALPFVAPFRALDMEAPKRWISRGIADLKNAAATVLLGLASFVALRRHGRSLPAWGSLTVLVLSLAGLLAWNVTFFGRPLGMYGLTAVSRPIGEIAMTFLGLHWDQGQGVFLQNPFLLLGLVGLSRGCFLTRGRGPDR